MRHGIWIGLATVAVVALVFIALTVGWTVWGGRLWAAGPLVASGGCGGAAGGARPAMMGRGLFGGIGGGGMMGGARGATVSAGCSAQGAAGASPSGSAITGTLSLADARDAAERYAAGLGIEGLEVGEVMEFERNFYAILKELTSGVGALEVLIDKASGAVYPEMGPNMMWNGRYGMHSQMMGGVSDSSTLSASAAEEIGQRWLDANRPGATVEDADAFYGYYTLHTERDGQIEGMLSVHGSSGQVWYHTWHGAFVAALD